MPDPIAIDLSHELGMDETLLHLGPRLSLRELRIVDSLVQRGKGCTGRRGDNPERFELLQKAQGPTAIFAPGEVPVLPVRALRAEIEDLQAFDVETAPLGGAGEATLAIEFEEA